jgi:hypothetical protein
VIFTDEDLQRLKECLKGNGECNVSCDGECADVRSLIARLEAAEADRDRFKNLLEMSELARKAAGK